MKILKFFSVFLLTLLCSATMFSCKKCKDEDPTARIINNGTQIASVQIKTSGGNTININNVNPATSSSYNSYAAGQVTFTIKVNTIDYVKIVDINKCYYYDIAIDANNNITVTPFNRN